MTAAELLREITRLYRQLDSPMDVDNVWRPTLAYLAIEAQIRDLSRRHWQLSGHAITATPPSRIPFRTLKGATREYVRAADGRRTYRMIPSRRRDVV